MNSPFRILTALYLFPITALGQISFHPSPEDFNFETAGGEKPYAWNHFGDDHYLFAVDSVSAQQGKRSLSISNESRADGFGAWRYTLPVVYPGKSITLRGFVKTENVDNGWAGLWMRHDPAGPFENMQERGIKGSTGWTEYEITLPLAASKTEQIVIGCLLAGQGKMWLDNLHVSIDGKDIAEIQPRTGMLKITGKRLEVGGGSGIMTIPSDPQTVENLRILGLVWGFVKYYHPNVMAGNINLDNELFDILPRLIAQPTQRDELLSRWLDKLGPVSPGKKPKTKGETILQPDLGWIETSGLSPGLTGQLQRIRNAKRGPRSHYVSFAPAIGNPVFKNETGYNQTAYPDAGIRLLALYRYWNMIQYFFPYRDLMEEDWKGVLNEFIPRVLRAGNETEYQLAILETITRIHDSHAGIWSLNGGLRKYFGEKRPPVELRFVENKPMVTGSYPSKSGDPFPASGLLPGDIILSVNGRPADELVREKLKYSPGSNYPTQLRDMAPYLLRTNDTLLRVSYLRNGVTAETVLKTYPNNRVDTYPKFQHKDTCFKLLRPDIGYLYPGSIRKVDMPVIKRRLNKTRGLVIDLRCYPTTSIIASFGAYLLPKRTPFVKATEADPQLPGRFAMGPDIRVGLPNATPYKGRVVILIDETTQSHAEFTAMALRTAPGATVIGSTTAGADGDVSDIYLPGNIHTGISGIGIYYPDGRGTQRVGIVPDIELRPTIKGLTEGRDELLEKAISVIDGK